MSTTHNSRHNIRIRSSNTQNDDVYQIDDSEEDQRATALDILASAYGNSSDSENDMVDSGIEYTDGPNFSKVSPDSDFESDNSNIRDPLHDNDFECASSPRLYCEVHVSSRFTNSDEENQCKTERSFENRNSNYDSSSFNLDKLASVGSNLGSFKTDKCSSRMHVFCLEHAMEVKRKLQPIGGVHMLLLCHPGLNS